MNSGLLRFLDILNDHVSSKVGNDVIKKEIEKAKNKKDSVKMNDLLQTLEPEIHFYLSFERITNVIFTPPSNAIKLFKLDDEDIEHLKKKYLVKMEKEFKDSLEAVK